MKTVCNYAQSIGGRVKIKMLDFTGPSVSIIWVVVWVPWQCPNVSAWSTALRRLRLVEWFRCIFIESKAGLVGRSLLMTVK